MAKTHRMFSADAMLSNQKGCGNCRWFRRADSEDYGECFLNPPIPVIEREYEEHEDSMSETTFQVNIRPQVDTVDICSKWDSNP